MELVASISGKENAKKALELAHDADGMIKLARAGRQLAHQLADAMSLRPDKYDRLFKERFAHQLQANPVVVMLGPDYESARDEEATAYCRLAFLKTALDVLGHGKSALNDHFDPNGDGPFKYVDIDGGFELGSALIYVATGDHRIRNALRGAADLSLSGSPTAVELGAAGLTIHKMTDRCRGWNRPALRSVEQAREGRRVANQAQPNRNGRFETG